MVMVPGFEDDGELSNQWCSHSKRPEILHNQETGYNIMTFSSLAFPSGAGALVAL